MGSAASVPEDTQVDMALARNLLGDQFDEEAFMKLESSVDRTVSGSIWNAHMLNAVSTSTNTLVCQRSKFEIDPSSTYLNCAAYSPLLLASKKAGIDGIDIKMQPQNIGPDDHFKQHASLRKKISQFLNIGRNMEEPDIVFHDEADRIATFPSVSYGLAIVAKNLHRLDNINAKKNIVTIHEEFPNDIYAFERVANELNLAVIAVEPSSKSSTDDADFALYVQTMGEMWNEKILQAITSETALVVVPHVHWIYGVVFQLELISRKCKACNALLVIDGSQSIGALPFDMNVIQPDALIVAAYKWMLGPYSIAFGYFGAFFDDGIPLEESWMNRSNSGQFSNLMNHDSKYRLLAQRYNMGEFSEFIHGPMLEVACDHLIESGGADAIYTYIQSHTADAVRKMKDLGITFINDDYRSAHLFGAILPSKTRRNMPVNINEFALKLKELQIYVSVRGKALRISFNTFNNTEDLNKLISAMEELLI